VHLNEKWNHREQREIEAGILSSNVKAQMTNQIQMTQWQIRAIWEWGKKARGKRKIKVEISTLRSSTKGGSASGGK